MTKFFVTRTLTYSENDHRRLASSQVASAMAVQQRSDELALVYEVTMRCVINQLASTSCNVHSCA